MDLDMAARLNDFQTVILTLSALIVGLCAYIVRMPTLSAGAGGPMSERRHYTKKTKLAAVIAADMSGVVEAERQTGIPESTIRYWAAQPEFAEIRAKTREDLADEIKIVAHLAWERIAQALRAGDMEPRDALFAAEKATSLRLLMSGDATSRTETRDITGSISDGELAAAIREAEQIATGPRGPQEASRAKGYELYAGDPVGFITDILDERPWTIQAEIAESPPGPSPGRGAVVLRLGQGLDRRPHRRWWVAPAASRSPPPTPPPGPRHPLARAAQGPRPGRPAGVPIPAVESRWEILGTGAFAIGVKPEDYNPEGLQGIHGRRVLVVIDEANGVGPDLWDAAKGLVVNETHGSSRSATPTSPRAVLRGVPGQTWHVIHISVYDTPNFTGEAVPEKAQAELVSPFWLEQRRAEGLEGTPWWQAKVLGQFPDTAATRSSPSPGWRRPAPVTTCPTSASGPGSTWPASAPMTRPSSRARATDPRAWHVVHGQDTMAVAGLGCAISPPAGARWRSTSSASAVAWSTGSRSNDHRASSSRSTSPRRPTTTPTSSSTSEPAVVGRPPAFAPRATNHSASPGSPNPTTSASAPS
jgi:hypothetical protein